MCRGKIEACVEVRRPYGVEPCGQDRSREVADRERLAEVEDVGGVHHVDCLNVDLATRLWEREKAFVLVFVLGVVILGGCAAVVQEVRVPDSPALVGKFTIADFAIFILILIPIVLVVIVIIIVDIIPALDMRQPIGHARNMQQSMSKHGLVYQRPDLEREFAEKRGLELRVCRERRGGAFPICGQRGKRWDGEGLRIVVESMVLRSGEEVEGTGEQA